jgi:ferrous iron transport protein B
VSPADGAAPTAGGRIDYGPEVERELAALERRVAGHPGARQLAAPARWVALQLLAGDLEVGARLDDADLVADAGRAAARIEAATGLDVGSLVADRRFDWVHEVVDGVVARDGADRRTWTDRIDAVLTHRWLGVPIFFAVMWVVFKVVTDVTAPFVDWIDAVVAGPVSRWVSSLVTAVGLGGGWVEGLLVDGAVAGVGGVLVFVPILVCLYVILSLLEDSGYMARAAFVMDRAMHRLGLHGRSFLPLLVGFGCNVPAISATRVLEHRRDRILTGLMVPFVSCAARLPVFVLLAAAFFREQRGTVVFAMYAISVAFVLAVGWALGRTVFRGQERSPFVLELPPYRWPAPRSTAVVTWQRTAGFLRKAGTVILAASMVVWLLLAVPVRGDGGFDGTPIEDSAFAAVAGGVAPAFAPAGFDSWELTGALVSGLVAKEVVVSTLGQVYGLVDDEGGDAGPDPSLGDDAREIASGFVDATRDAAAAVPRIVGVDFAETDPVDSSLVSAVRDDFERTSGGHGALAAFAFMLFVLLYVPCTATIAAQRAELGGGWAWFSVALNTGVAWLVATLVFQLGRLLGVG